MKCQRCHHEEGVHPYGKFKICDECMQWIEINWKSEPDQSKIQIAQETKMGSEGSYHHGRGIIMLRELVESTLELIISHETMHHVLNHFISVQTSYCYDNVSGRAEIENWLEL